MGFSVNSKSKTIKSDTYDSATSFNQLVGEISKRNRLNKNRIRLTNKNGQVINSDALLNSEGSSELFAKDLGPQIGWRLVYLIEYVGPIIFHFLAYNYFKNDDYELVYKLTLIHYLKREFENIFVHKFSNATMPLFNIFKNCFHYWVLGSLSALQYGGYGNFDFGFNYNKDIAFYIWTISEFFNGVTHIQLRLLGDKTLRQNKKRELPRGGFFEFFISPNYTFEIYSWIAMVFLNPNLFTIGFAIVGAVQMYFWAIKKDARYGRTGRKFLIPLIF